MVRQTISCALVGLALLESVAQGINIYVTNECTESITLAHVTPGGVSTDQVAAGGTIIKSFAAGTGSHVFKSGTGAQATLAEFSAEGGKCWMDISIIPTGEMSGPECCPNLQACKDLTGGVGFNVAMQITPHTQDGARCVELTCMYDGCTDAYQFPKDDTKTHTCPLSTDYDLTFCPGGSGGGYAAVTQYEPIPPQAQIPAPAPPLASTTATAPPPASTTAPAPAPPPAPTTAPPPAPNTAVEPISAPVSISMPASAPFSKQTLSSNVEQTSLLNTGYGDSASQELHNIVLSSKSVDLGLEVKAGDDKVHKTNVERVQNYVTRSNTTSDIVQQPIYTKDDVVQPITVPSPDTYSNEEDVQHINNRSKKSNDCSTPYVVLGLGAFVGIVAAAAIVVVRKKKAKLEELESKTPLSAMAYGTLSSFRTPRDEVSVL
ncbi:unnamed protein product [Peronospora belbahrii]|uniref:Uncharacterized protein n=1 Tax=Peronospora belbahrii TaxID=622444 RepID=A0ABN8CLI9_9STRA|nr:unnamed protein product [Peronospora belbahrii]